MSLQLPDRPAKYFIDQILIPSWDASVAKGYDVNANPGDEAFIPVATTIDDVGAVYPSLVIQYSNETSGGQTSYDYLTGNGPGQNRQGTLLAIARAQDSDGGYTGDSATYASEPADDIVVHVIEAVEHAVQANAAGGSTEFETLGSQRGPDAPDDQETDPTTRLANTQILYTWNRSP
jgi:hypothetical protein